MHYICAWHTCNEVVEAEVAFSGSQRLLEAVFDDMTHAWGWRLGGDLKMGAWRVVTLNSRRLGIGGLEDRRGLRALGNRRRLSRRSYKQIGSGQ